MSEDNLSYDDTQISVTPSHQDTTPCPLCEVTVVPGGLGRHFRSKHTKADLTAPWNMRLKGHERYVRCEGCTRICAGTRGLGYHLLHSTCTNNDQLDNLFARWIPIRGVSITRTTQRGRHRSSVNTQKRRRDQNWTSLSSDESQQDILHCDSCGQNHRSNQCPHVVSA